MSREEVKRKIRDALRSYFGQDDFIDVSDSPEENVHVVIVSRKFDGKRMKDKHDLIWSVLVQHLTPDEWGKVTLTIGVSPEDVKVFS